MSDEPVPEAVVGGPVVPLATVAPAQAAVVLRDAAEAALGRPVQLAAPLAPVPTGFGPNAFGGRLAGIDRPPWSGPLVVRVTHSAERAEAERAWHRWAARHGFPTPPVLAAWVGDPAGIVLARPMLQPSLDRMGVDPAGIPSLLGSLGRLHARLHAQPVDDAPVRVTDRARAMRLLDDRLAVTGGAGLEEERAWLGAHDPGAAELVPCHGDYTPLNVHVAAQDSRSVVLTSWVMASRADRELDVAASELAFWSAAYLSPDRALRSMLRMARGFMINAYRAGYSVVGAPPDSRRLTYWACYHACLWSATAAAAEIPASGQVGNWPAVEMQRQRALFRRDLAERFDELASSF